MTTTHTIYLLTAYKKGELAAIWRQQTDEMIACTPKFSPLRCGEIIAAKLARQAGIEYATLERKTKPFCMNLEEMTLYDWLVDDNYNVKEELINLSGTRTLLADMESLDGRKHANAVYYIIEGLPPYLLVLEPHDIEPRKIQIEFTSRHAGYWPDEQLHVYMRTTYTNPTTLKHSTWLRKQGQSEWDQELEKRQGAAQ